MLIEESWFHFPVCLSVCLCVTFNSGTVIPRDVIFGGFRDLSERGKKWAEPSLGIKWFPSYGQNWPKKKALNADVSQTANIIEMSQNK
jgi:hypothetical protein